MVITCAGCLGAVAAMVEKFDPLWFCGPGDEAAHRQSLIAQAAYFRAQQRGFEPGHELEDWLAAEKELTSLIAGGTSSRDSKS